MAATNAALALGGMTHCCLSHGLRSFLKRPPDGGRVDALDRLQLDQLVGQQPPGPAGLALRRRGAGQGDQPRLLLAVEFAVLAVLGLLLVHGGVEALGGELGADAGDGHAVDVQRLYDALVGPGVRPCGVSLEQGPGAAGGVGRVGAGVDRPLQRGAILGG
jgi:hypothetical protein